MLEKTDPQKIIKTFRQAEKWLFTLITDPKGERYFQEKSMEVRMQEFAEQIDRTQEFMDYCGNPEKKFNSVHVAGTSGKGSVVNLISGLLAGGDYKIGYHVSPYLQVCTEKLVVGGKRISPTEFVALVETFKDYYQGWKKESNTFTDLKYGEAWVALTYLHMAQNQVDWGIIETGLGGRYDPTNVLPSRLGVITNVNYDHMEVLGEDLESIASHKAGIIKPGGVAITAETNPVVVKVLKEEARSKGAKLYCLREDFDYSIEKQAGAKTLSVRGVHGNYLDLHLDMLGDFQYENAALAVAAVDVLRHEMGVDLTEDCIRKQLQAIHHSGRFEIVAKKPAVILDGAHNQHKAKALADSLASQYPEKRFIFVLGTLSIKDFSGIIEALAPVAKLWVATQPKVFGKPSAAPEVLSGVIHKVTPDLKVVQEDDVHGAISAAKSLADEDDIIVITGSLYMVGAAREEWFSSDVILLADEANKAG